MTREEALSGEKRAQLVQRVASLARLEPSRIAPDAHFVTELGLSSLDLLSVLAFAEELSGARFPDELLGSLTTLGRIDDAIARHRPTATDEHLP